MKRVIFFHALSLKSKSRHSLNLKLQKALIAEYLIDLRKKDAIQF